MILLSSFTLTSFFLFMFNILYFFDMREYLHVWTIKQYFKLPRVWVMNLAIGCLLFVLFTIALIMRLF